MTTKYYLKENCSNWNNRFNPYGLREQKLCDKYCIYCKGSQFTRGAEITKLIEKLLSLMINKSYVRLELKDLIEIVEEEN